MTNTVDFYLRLSVDRDGKDSLDRQEADLRAWATREGLTVRKVWKDAGKSGYRKDVEREEFDAAVRAVSAGEVGTLAVWKLDRLSRRGAGQVGLVLDDVEDAGGRLYFLRDSLDSTVPGHRMVIVVVSEQARAESANTSLRVKDKIAKDAAKGIPKVGTRPFGYEADGMTLRPSEADLIRAAVHSILEEGGSMIRVAKHWNNLGALTDGMTRERRGKDGVKKKARPYWTATTVRSVLLRQRNAGILMHDGAEMPESRIEPIITRAELEAMHARVKVGTPLGARAKSLLGGIIRCQCGAPMHQTTGYSQRKGGPRNVYTVYACSQKLYDKTQKHATVQAHIADAKVRQEVVVAMAAGKLRTDDDSTTNLRLTDLDARLSVLTDQEARAEDALIDGLGDPKRIKGRLQAIKAERAELDAERSEILAQDSAGSALRLFATAMDLVLEHGDEEAQLATMTRGFGYWDALPLEDRQAIIRAKFGVRVTLGGRGADRVQVV